MANAIEAIHRNELEPSLERDGPTPRPPSMLDALRSVHQVTARPTQKTESLSTRHDKRHHCGEKKRDEDKWFQ